MRDLKIGHFITVTKWTSHSDNSYCGDVLEIHAINLPYIVVQNHSATYEPLKMVTLDLRRIETQFLTPDFVQARTGLNVTPDEWADEII